MAYRVIYLQLTDEQMATINAALGDSKKPFALLAQPQVRGLRSGEMPVYVLAAEQYKAVDTAIVAARQLEAWQ